jgi:uncharacterized protein YndB with AHSA1/START domain
VTQLAAPTSLPVRSSVVVHAPIEDAWHVFTADMTSWWPSTHHIGAAPMVAAIVEPRVGGRWYELDDDGSQCDWGLVLVWDPPHHLVLSWHLDGDYRYHPEVETASRVDVRFEALAQGSTRVTLEHSGFERHGPTWRRLRDGVSGGWQRILDRFGRRADGLDLPPPPPVRSVS